MHIHEPLHQTLPTSEVLVHLDEHNCATYEICKPVAWDEIHLNDDLIKEAGNSKAIVFGSLASRSEVTRNTLMELLKNDILKIMDVNLRPPYDTEEIVKILLSYSDIVKLNDEELMIISDWYQLSGTMDERMNSFYKLLKIKTLIVRKATSSEITEQAVKDGMRTMIEDGFVKAARGVTSIEEVLRVITE